VRRRIRSASALAVLAAVVLAGCGASASSGEGPTPGVVAQSFVADLYSGRHEQALASVDPSERKEVSAALAGHAASSLQAHDVRIESTEIRGDSAKVTLFGTFCVYGTSSSTAPDCVTHDPGEAAGSGFAEYLLQVDGRWYIAAQEATAFR
jgi:hypothetical protein